MGSRYRREGARLRSEIVARVAAGEPLRVVCAAAGMPGRQTVRAWARADALFAADLGRAEAALAAGRLRFDEAKAAALLARARAGEAINGLLREAGMPGRRAYRHWCASQPPFAEAVFALRRRRDQEIGWRGRARLRAWDAALGDQILVAVIRGATLAGALAADPALPSLPVVRRWRREQPAFDAELRAVLVVRQRRHGRARGCTPQVAQRIVDRIVEGGSFNSIGREPGMPSRQTLRAWVRARPDFARAVARACEDREDWYDDQILMISEAATPATLEVAKRQVGRIKRQLVRLRHRPGAAHRKPGAGGLGAGGLGERGGVNPSHGT